MELSLKELKPIITYIIDNNAKLESEGKLPIALNIVGEAGIGKSAIVEQIAEEYDANFVKLNLGQITETGDLAGFPLLLHYACSQDGTDCRWIAPELIESFAKGGYQLTGETKMSYALPEWYKNIDINKKTVLVLDDATRALPNILQAVYELIYKQEFWSFHLPKGTTVILTSNPTGGDYNVNELDEAGMSRMLNFNVKFDIESWSSWAEEQELDSRVINFLLSYHSELMDPQETHTHIMNSRSYTMFGNVIGGIKDWSRPDSLAMILQIASGCFNDKENIVGNLFTTFVANKLDQLITPKDMLFGDWEKIQPRIESCVYDEADNYRPAVAAILQTRLLNYSMYHFSQKGSKTEPVIERLLAIMDSEKMLFSEDLLFNIIKTLGTKYMSRMNKAMYNERIRKIILG